MTQSWADYMGFYVGRDDVENHPQWAVFNKQGHVVAAGFETEEAAEIERQYRGDLERRQCEAGRTLAK